MTSFLFFRLKNWTKDLERRAWNDIRSSWLCRELKCFKSNRFWNEFLYRSKLFKVEVKIDRLDGLLRLICSNFQHIENSLVWRKEDRLNYSNWILTDWIIHQRIEPAFCSFFSRWIDAWKPVVTNEKRKCISFVTNRNVILDSAPPRQ